MKSPANIILPDAILKRSSTAEQVAELVREAILRGTLLPGTPLREGPLAASLGVSRHTLREAMRLLAAEGLVNHHLHRGVAVAQLSAQDVHDLFRARYVLELAGFDAIHDDPGDTAAQLLAIAERLESAAQAKDWRDLAEHDLAFHRRIVAGLDSRRLDATYAGIQRELRLGLVLADSDLQVSQHRELVDLIASDQWEAARQHLHEHLIAAEALVGDAIRARAHATSAD